MEAFGRSINIYIPGRKKPGFLEKSSLYPRDIDAETGFLTPRASRTDLFTDIAVLAGVVKFFTPPQPSPY
ncbi:MAG: hypothetical protein EAZ78_18165 [Oscillatoriales cyanobacterium]|nr:MAG: hypothetical protein EA000_14720 [Oscillatoriales cyanobacterium]TAF01487.1 MAG: hypothetical protein EAZ78_18165 [Oscillatoriales cyanobacterium]TAF32864.1 MAG: hypothetical protein EAZ68_20475 [Oscillatoriales cyanobacterium]TAF61778.1 MAG: hypothetical protein EAZ59_25080 [Oscillatoriales cyanobacterium]